jgi:hypothetical protein
LLVVQNFDSLRETLNGIANDIASAQSDPETWRFSLLYLVEILESKAQDPINFESMLANLCDDLAVRVEIGRW